jgi:hypothetical protein
VGCAFIVECKIFSTVSLTLLAGDQASNTVLRLLPLLEPSARLFECGFGYGRDAIFLVKTGFLVHGIDPSEVGTSPTPNLLFASVT